MTAESTARWWTIKENNLTPGEILDVSWFMRTLNEHVARRANAEGGVKGRFWEGPNLNLWDTHFIEQSPSR